MKDASSGAGAASAALLVLHLVLSPLLFSAFSLESFEFPKALLLRGTAVLLAALGCVGLLSRATTSGGTTRSGASWRSIRAVTRDPVAWGAIAFLVSGALSTLFSLSPRTSLLGSRESWTGLLTLAAYTILFFATRSLVTRAAAVRLLLWAIASAVAGSTIYALFQLAGLDPVPWSDLKRTGDFERVASTLGNPNFLGGYLAVAFAPCVLLSLRAWRLGSRGVAGFLALLSLLAAGVCVATLSRAEWLALLSAVAVLLAGFFYLGERRRARALAVAAVVVVIAGASYTATDHGSQIARAAAQRVARLADPAAEPRLELWRLGWQMFVSRPLLGVGLDAFQLAYPRHQSPASWMFSLDQAPAHAHNEPLQVLATQGALGLAAAAVVAIGLVTAGRRALRRARIDGAMVLGVVAGLAAFAVRSLFGFTVIALGTLVTSYAAILSRAGDTDNHGHAVAGAPLRPRALGLLLAAAGALATLGFLANGFAISGLPRSQVLAVGLSILLAQLAVALAAWRVEELEQAGRAGAGQNQMGAETRRAEAVRQRFFHLPQLVPWLAAAWLLHRLVYLPFAADALGRMGHRLVTTGAEETAIPLLERAVQLAPGIEYLWIELGVAHHRAAAAVAPDTDRARAHLEQALEAHARAAALVPVNPVNYANTGRTLADLARWHPGRSSPREALAAFEEALALAPLSPRILDDASQVALVLGDPDSAEAHARRCASLYPRHARARSLLGAVAMARSDWATAARQLRAATEADWRGDFVAEAAAWANLATAYLELDLPEQALAAAGESVVRWPAYANGWQLKARARSALATRRARQGRAEARSQELLRKPSR